MKTDSNSNGGTVSIPPGATICLALHQLGRTRIGRQLLAALYSESCREYGYDQFRKLYMTPERMSVRDLADRLSRSESWVREMLPQLADGPDPMWHVGPMRDGRGWRVTLDRQWVRYQ